MEKISVSKFIKNYNIKKSPDVKKEYIESCVIRTYAPVMEKRGLLQLMLDKSVVDDKENNIKYIDMMSSKINLTCAVVALYTNIIPDVDENGKAKNIEMYDALISSGVFEYMCNYVGKREISELTSINASLIETWNNSNTSSLAVANSMVGFFADRFADTFGVVGKDIIDIVNDEEKLNDVIDKAKKYIKPIIKNFK